VKNFLTIEIESYVGAVFILLLSSFFVGFIFIAMKNLGSDVVVINSEQVQVKTISVTERVLIQNWLKENKVEIPEEVGYRYLIAKYPSKPWLK